MDNSLKGLLLAAGVIITCIVVGLAFYISREARDTANTGAGQISKMNAEFNESDKVMYDGLEVSGSEVINVVNKFKNEALSVTVKNGKGTSVSYGRTITITDGVGTLGSSSTADIKDAQVSTNGAYINPNGQFKGSVIRDSNNVIVGINFVQV